MYGNGTGTQPLHGGKQTLRHDFRRDLDSLVQEILRANAYVKTAADLATKYRKNVQYNLEATKGNQPEGHT